jgi:trehalose-phosphatase
VTAAAAENIKTFFDGFAGNPTPLLLLDYDGTLAPFRVDRFQARPWAGVRELLTRIQRQGRTRMAIISGRSAHEIGPLLGMDPPLEVWGLHGAERLFPNGRSEVQPAPAAARKKLDKLRALLKRDSFGGHFEDKANAAVIHWRGASPHKARLIEQRARALFEPLAETDGLELL